ncbi:hypothetical protein NEOLEDRAFT_1182807, partial [Neolentinus lepideus HHB14362 ss-1]
MARPQLSRHHRTIERPRPLSLFRQHRASIGSIARPRIIEEARPNAKSRRTRLAPVRGAARVLEELEQHQERFLDLVERERINSEAIEEVYNAAVAIANRLYPGHFAQTPSDIPHSDSESSEEVPLASLFPRRRSARIAALSAPPSQTASPPPISPINEHPNLPPSTPETISETSPMTDVKALPSHRDKAAPVFDPENPRSLLRYLEDLEDLFKAHPTLITNEADKKRAAIKYVPMHEEEMWKGLPEYKDAAKTYEEFVTALKTLYPAVREDQRYSVGDMDRL